ncbi:MAG: YwaF family protein [Clostridia bacterium]|nr:YwaF family protein [Clostridia bacterium]
MFTLLTILFASLLICIGVFVLSKKDLCGKYLMAIAAIYFVLGIIRMHFSDSFVETVIGGADLAESFIRWGYYIGYAILPLSVFTDNRTFRNIAICFSLPIALIMAVRFETTMGYFLAPGGGGWYVDEWIRYLMHTVEIGLAIAIPSLMLYHTKHSFNYKSKKEWLNLALVLPAALLYMMPPYMPQSLVGFTNIPAGLFSAFHIAWLVVTAAEIAGIYLVFKNKSTKEKWELIYFIVLAEFYLSNSSLLRGFKWSRIPIQLCCVAAFFYLFVILTKSKKMFNFCYLCNISGAMVAFALPSFSSETLCCWNIHYMYEHTMVLAFPVLALSLGLFPKLSKSSIKDMTLRYIGYFSFCMVLGFLINLLSDVAVYDVNYFYMFDYSEAISYLPFVTFTGLIDIPVGGISIYPLLILTVFTFFYLLALLNFAITKGICKLTQGLKHRDRKKERRRKEKAPAVAIAE